MYPALLGSFDEAHPYDAVHQSLAEIATAAGVRALDLREPLAGAEPEALWAHTHDRHPNGECNARVAAYLKEHLASATTLASAPR
jgi:hypothetical protein